MSDIKGMFSSGGTAWPELNWVVTDSLAVPTEADEDSERFPVPEPADVAFLQYTSGMNGGRSVGGREECRKGEAVGGGGEGVSMSKELQSEVMKPAFRCRERCIASCYEKLDPYFRCCFACLSLFFFV